MNVIKPEPVQEAAPALPEAKEQLSQATVEAEIPYESYQETTGKPFIADCYGLGDFWEVHSKEIDTINSYVNRKIQTGDIASSQTAVKDLLKSLEKFNNLGKEERAVVKLGVLASYVKFLESSEEVKHNSVKYGNY